MRNTKYQILNTKNNELLRSKTAVYPSESSFGVHPRNKLRGILAQNKGFTLIELLVSIAIISVLVGLIVVNFIGVRQKGRDGARKSDLRQIQSALELYRSDLGVYPTTIPSCGSALASGSTTYMQKIPCDPLSKASYSYSSDGSTYTIFACLENANDPDRDGTKQTACAGTVASLTVKNP